MPRIRKKSANSKLNRTQVIDRIMELIEALPEAVADLPAPLKERKEWQRLFSQKLEQIPRILEVLSQLPAFTNQAPKTKKGWKDVFRRHMGLQQVPQLLRYLHAQASRQPLRRKKVVYWREAYGPNEIVQRVRPEESFDYLHNPHRGTTTFQRFQGEDTYPAWVTADTYGPVEFPAAGKTIPNNVKYIPRTTLAYCRWPWSWFEPQKGQYCWTLVDQTLKAARARGQTAQLRLQPYSLRVDYAKNPPKSRRHPEGSSVNVPDWYWDSGAKWLEKGMFAPHEPDSNDPLYLQHFGDFIRALAARYDGHPDLESLDVAYGGFWGESGGNSTPETAQKLTQIYLESFKKTQLLSMLGSHGCQYAARVAGGRLGWRADSFGDLNISRIPEVPEKSAFNHMYDSYPREIALAGLSDAWKTAPVTMESSANVAVWVMDGYDVDKIIAEGYKYHTSVFMPKNAFFPEKALEKLTEFDRKIGYRFALRQLLLPLEIKPGSKFKAEFYIDNVGCAPIYRPYKLALRFKQGKQAHVVTLKEDIRKWLPGHTFFIEEVAFPQALQRGEVKLALGIVDERLTPRVWFAIQGQADEGWHPLTSLEAL